jgi:hypothetical protein
MRWERAVFRNVVSRAGVPSVSPRTSPVEIFFTSSEDGWFSETSARSAGDEAVLCSGGVSGRLDQCEDGSALSRSGRYIGVSGDASFSVDVLGSDCIVVGSATTTFDPGKRLMRLSSTSVVLAAVLFMACAATPFGRGDQTVVEFTFQVLDVDTPRQEGQVVDLFVRYRYERGLATADYPDYREVRRPVLEFMKIRPEEPAMEYWEVLDRDLVRQLRKSFPFSGVCVQLRVHPSDRPGLVEPGIHAAIAAVGDVEPVSCQGLPAPGRTQEAKG